MLSCFIIIIIIGLFSFHLPKLLFVFWLLFRRSDPTCAVVSGTLGWKAVSRCGYLWIIQTKSVGGWSTKQPTRWKAERLSWRWNLIMRKTYSFQAWNETGCNLKGECAIFTTIYSVLSYQAFIRFTQNACEFCTTQFVVCIRTCTDTQNPMTSISHNSTNGKVNPSKYRSNGF